MEGPEGHRKKHRGHGFNPLLATCDALMRRILSPDVPDRRMRVAKPIYFPSRAGSDCPLLRVMFSVRNVSTSDQTSVHLSPMLVFWILTPRARRQPPCALRRCI